MPCSSSETGAGSNWESCCSALTAFFTAPPATSSRIGTLLRGGSRSRARGPRDGGGRRNAVGSTEVLQRPFASPVERVPTPSADSTTARRPSAHEYGEGSISLEDVHHVSYHDVDDPQSASLLAGPGPAAEDINGRNRWPPPYFSNVVRRGATASGYSDSPHGTEGHAPAIRPSSYEEHHRQPEFDAGTTAPLLLAEVAATSTNTAGTFSGSELSVVYADSSAALTGAAVVTTTAPPAVCSSSTAVASRPRGDVPCTALAHNDGNFTRRQAELLYTPSEGSFRAGIARCGAMRLPLEIDINTIPVFHASGASVTWGRGGRTPMAGGCEAEEPGLTVQPTAQQLERRMPAPLTSSPVSCRENDESHPSSGKTFGGVSVETTGAGFRCEAEGRAGSTQDERSVPESTTAGSSGESGGNYNALEVRTGVGAEDMSNLRTQRFTNADWRSDEAVCNRGARSAYEGRRALFAATASSAAAAAVSRRTASATSTDAAVIAHQTIAQSVTPLYCAGQPLPRKETKPQVTSLLLLGAETQQPEASLASQQGSTVRVAQRSCQGNPTNNVALTQRIMRSEPTGAAGELSYGQPPRNVEISRASPPAQCGKAGITQGERPSIEQRSADDSFPETVPESNWGASACSLRGTGSQRAQECMHDGDDSTQVISGFVRQHTHPSALLRGKSLTFGSREHSTAPHGLRKTMQCGEALQPARPLESETMIKAGTGSLVNASVNDAVETTQSARMSLVGKSFCFSGGKRLGQPSRQRPCAGGGDKGNVYADNYLAGERMFAPRRRCQRPASWKRVRQTVGEGQLSCRGCDLVSPVAPHGCGGLGGHVQRKHCEQQQRSTAQQGRKEGCIARTATDAVENNKSATGNSNEGDGGEETLLCRSGGAREGVGVKRLAVEEKSSCRAGEKPAGESAADTSTSTSSGSHLPSSTLASASVVFMENDVRVSDESLARQRSTSEAEKQGMHKLHDTGKLYRGTVRWEVLSSESAVNADHSEYRRESPSKPFVKCQTPPLSAVSCGDPPITSKALCRSSEYSADEGEMSDRSSPPLASSRGTNMLSADQERRGACTHSVTAPSVVGHVDASVSQAMPKNESAAELEGTCPSNERQGPGSILRMERDRSHGAVNESSRRRSIGPGEFGKFEEESSSSDESSISGEETGHQHQLSSQMLPPQHRGAGQSLTRALSAAAGGSRSLCLSACMKPFRAARYECAPEAVDEDEASRFFKRRRCSLLLWGGIRADRTHLAVNRPSPEPTAQGPAGAAGSAGEPDRSGSGVTSTTNASGAESFRQHPETTESAPTRARGQRLQQQGSEKQLSSEKRAAEERREEEGIVTESHESAAPVVPTAQVISDVTAGPFGPSVARLRKRKRGVGASASRLLFLRRPGTGYSSDDAALVNSLSSALTYEETQQLRQRERERRQQELLRQHEEARRKEKAAAARLLEQQKAAAMAIAAANAQASPSAPYIFGSGTAAAPQSTVSDARTPTAVPVQRTGLATATGDRSSSGSAVVDRAAPMPPAGSTECLGAHASTPFPLARGFSPIAQTAAEQQQQMKDVLSGRPKLRIIRSPPSAGDSAGPHGSGGGAAARSLPGPSTAAVALCTSTQTTANGPNIIAAGSCSQQGELRLSTGVGAGPTTSPTGSGRASVAQQPQTSGGLLPAEFGGVLMTPGGLGTGLGAPRAFGSASGFGMPSAGAGNAAGEAPQ